MEISRLRLGEMEACPACSVFYPEEHFKGYDNQGMPVTYLDCKLCRTVEKVSVDCFSCGAAVFFKEQELETRSNHAGTRITQSGQGHLIVFKGGFVVACCWPLTRVTEITETVAELIQTMPLVTR